MKHYPLKVDLSPYTDRAFKTHAAMLAYIEQDEIPCLICGKPFVALGVHLGNEHGITAREYKVAFNIPQRRGLLGASAKLHLRELATRADRVENALAMGQIYGPVYGPANKNYRKEAPRYEDLHPPVYKRVKPPVIDHSSAAPGELEKLKTTLKSMPLPPGYEQNSLVARVERLEKLAFRILRALEQFERKE
jgi:hypothetical protein